jgi:hypothetical protein
MSCPGSCPDNRAIVLDGEIKRVMSVDPHDERLNTWKPGHNITYCPDKDKMINTTINSIATLLSEFATTCNTLRVSDAIDRYLELAWKYANQPNGDPTLFLTEAKSRLVLTEAKSRLGWYYVVCTDHSDAWFNEDDFKGFAIVAASLTSVDIAINDPANENIYKARAAKYEKWRDALYAAEGKKSLARRVWEHLTAPH